MTPDTLLGRWSSKVQVLSNGCWEWTGASSGRGYGTISKGGRPAYAHRIAWELFNGPILEGVCVLHHCDNKICVRPSHLFLGTKSDNTRDMYAKGRGYDHRGRKNGQAKLTEVQVHEILVSDLSQRKLARAYGVDQKSISNIKLRKTWTCLQEGL